MHFGWIHVSWFSIAIIVIIGVVQGIRQGIQDQRAIKRREQQGFPPYPGNDQAGDH